MSLINQYYISEDNAYLEKSSQQVIKYFNSIHAKLVLLRNVWVLTT